MKENYFYIIKDEFFKRFSDMGCTLTQKISTYILYPKLAGFVLRSDNNESAIRRAL